MPSLVVSGAAQYATMLTSFLVLSLSSLDGAKSLSWAELNPPTVSAGSCQWPTTKSNGTVHAQFPWLCRQ